MMFRFFFAFVACETLTNFRNKNTFSSCRTHTHAHTHIQKHTEQWSEVHISRFFAYSKCKQNIWVCDKDLNRTIQSASQSKNKKFAEVARNRFALMPSRKTHRTNILVLCFFYLSSFFCWCCRPCCFFFSIILRLHDSVHAHVVYTNINNIIRTSTCTHEEEEEEKNEKMKKRIQWNALCEWN